MTFEWKHPNYYAELKKQFKKLQESENDGESEYNEDKEFDSKNQDK